MYRLIAASLVIVFGCMPTLGLAQPAEAIKYYRNAYLKVAANYRNQVRRYLSAVDRSTIDGITFRFNSTQDIFAQAFITNDRQRIVELSFGFLAFMENLTLAYAITGEARKEVCFWHYLDQVSYILLANAKATRMNQPLQLVPFFVHYVRSGGKGCETIVESDLANRSAHDYVAGGMDTVLAMTLGHEVAHHIRGHVDSSTSKSLAASRQAETEADTWAVEHAFAIGINPSPAVPLWALFSVVGGADIKAELESTHPLGIRRFADALDGIIRYVKSPAYEKKFGRKIDSWMIEELERMRNQVRRLVP